MKDEGIDFVCRQNVIFELYKACLDGEITKDEFLKVKAIVNRAVPVEEETILKWLY